MDQRILDKIKKCLRLSQSDNPNEAAAAVRQAQKLMAKHGIGEDDVALSDVQTSRAKGPAAFTPPNWLWSLIRLVSNAFGVQNIYVAQRGPETGWKAQGAVEFIGVGSAPEIAQYAFTILHRQLKRDRASFLKDINPRMKRSNKTRRADLFAEAWIFAVKQKVQTLIVPEAEQELVDKWMARRCEEAGVTAAKKKSYKKINRADAGAMMSGMIAGSKVQLHQGVNGKESDLAIDHSPQQGGG